MKLIYILYKMCEILLNKDNKKCCFVIKLFFVIGFVMFWVILWNYYKYYCILLLNSGNNKIDVIYCKW